MSVIVLALLNIVLANAVLHPDTGLNIFDMVKRHGYPVERHQQVETQDGYLLELHRIPHGLQQSSPRKKGPVLIVHGLCCSSVDWVNLGVGRSLAYALVDRGYDVWLGNLRGTTWSSKHRNLDPRLDEEKYWDFSHNEVGLYDLPAMIDHILDVTGEQKLHYVGHSMGTTAFFVMASEKPEYNDKVKLMSALAPAVFMGHMRNPLFRFLAPYEQHLEYTSKVAGQYSVGVSGALVEFIGSTICADPTLAGSICTNIAFFVTGYDPQQLNTTLLPVILTNFPTTMSTKQLLHFSQMTVKGDFRKYDYRFEEANRQMYGLESPPAYNLSRATVPVALHYGQNDLICDVQDVEILRRTLPNVVVDNKIVYEKFNHLDFMWATDANELLYDDVVAVIERY